ncbi:hypothetical protein [Corynebacterium sp. Marseille-Q2823]|uniref:hypothetical protein n=1 Tax=Corynebacterium sp. Marseille-Q2823 TaxID=2736606 RepID=UPI0020CA885F|nr:hypothetical protein [Corynebacterium sp. Marseille-Q2823]
MPNSVVPTLVGTGLGLKTVEQRIDEPGPQLRKEFGFYWRAGQWAGEKPDADAGDAVHNIAPSSLRILIKSFIAIVGILVVIGLTLWAF